MKVILLMFDSLNRHLLAPYGCTWTHTPNFQRLAQHSVTFDKSYVCSMPCMPARRDLHTGRPNFLHRSWGPLEPFDDSIFTLLKKRGVYSHLVTDHYHYFEAGGATYHLPYNTWEFFRGQEGDPWIGQVARPKLPPRTSPRHGAWIEQDWINRQHLSRPELQSQARTVVAGLDFIRRNHDQDNWLLQIETFDPHEPFFSHRRYKDLFAAHYAAHRQAGAGNFDWPPYGPVTEPKTQVEHCRHEYASLLAMCDDSLGNVLDLMDELDLWKDTMLIVWTDHGFLLGEHDRWGKCVMPYYEEVAHTPLWVWDPRCDSAGQRRQALVQPAIDLGPTVLEAFNVEATADMRGCALRNTISTDTPVRPAAIFGHHGGQVTITDGRYVYMRSPARAENTPLYNYTLMPAHMRELFPVAELRLAELVGPWPFTKNCPILKIPVPSPGWLAPQNPFGTRLYDVDNDPGQENPLTDAATEQRLVQAMIDLMEAYEAPAEQYERLGLR